MKTIDPVKPPAEPAPATRPVPEIPGAPETPQIEPAAPPAEEPFPSVVPEIPRPGTD